MLTCGCGRWMHVHGIAEDAGSAPGPDGWLVRFECGCGGRIGATCTPEEGAALADRLMWTDEARSRLERLPPYLQVLVKEETEEFARVRGQRVVTETLLQQARQGGTVQWDAEAERRLERVPAPVRAMARVELERTALERGATAVTVALMEDVKARYFGMFQNH